jgi:hypothetical protein
MSDESHRAWQHLTLAGIVPGSYTGTHTANQSVIGVNIPASRFDGTGWCFARWTGPFNYNNLPPSHYLCLGRQASTHPHIGAMTAGEAQAMDEKEDDGRPALGSMIAGNAACATDADAATVYNVGTSTGNDCHLLFVLY